MAKDDPPFAAPPGLESLLPRFIAEMEADAVRLADLAGNPADLAVHAHAMRGKAGMFGEEVLYRLLTEIEAGCRNPQNEQMKNLISRVVERVSQLCVYGRQAEAAVQRPGA